MVAGVKVASQTPAIRSGQRIIFLTLDDATGPVDVTVFESVQPKVAKTVFHSFVLAVWGQSGGQGKGRLGGRRGRVGPDGAARARQGRLAEALAHEALARPAVPRKLWHSSGGSAGDDAPLRAGGTLRDDDQREVERADPARRPRCVLRLRRDAQGPEPFGQARRRGRRRDARGRDVGVLRGAGVRDPSARCPPCALVACVRT